MKPNSESLFNVYEGWDGYQTSLVKALAPLTAEQLAARPVVSLRSVGELFRHIALGCLDWFLRMNAPGSQELAQRINDWHEDQYGHRHIIEEALPITEDVHELKTWLQDSWGMIDQTLNTWRVEDLKTTYRHTYRDTTYAVSHQ